MFPSLEGEDERQEERRLRDLRGCVPRARVVVTAAPGLAETLAAGWRKATQFYARFGITERRLVREVDPGGFRGASLTESGWLPTHALIEASEHAPSVLPMSETA